MNLKCLMAALVICCAFLTTPASAQATRTWVSGVGDDVNPCSRTAPCKTFAGAISKTAAGGEINCLDPGGFGALTITKSITIDCAGTLGSALAAGGINGFVVNAPNGKVVLRNLAINGAGTGLNGIRILDAASVHVSNVTIQGFVSPNSSGISVGGGSAKIVVMNSDISLNHNGVQVLPAATATVVIRGSALTANANAAIAADGKNGVWVGSSLIAANATGVIASNGATIQSFGDNDVEGNSNAGTFSSPASKKQ